MTEPHPTRAMMHQQPDERIVSILAVDDSAANLMVLATFLRHATITVQLADGGAEAIAAFKASVPDLVFMDLSMPVVDGFAAAAAIRQFEAANGQLRAPIVALTAFAVDEILIKQVNVSMDAHLSKPVRKADIRRLLYTYRLIDNL